MSWELRKRWVSIGEKYREMYGKIYQEVYRVGIRGLDREKGGYRSRFEEKRWVYSRQLDGGDFICLASIYFTYTLYFLRV